MSEHDRQCKRCEAVKAENARLRAALKALFVSMDAPGRHGDEYACEWVHEVWKVVVPLDVRKAAGDTSTTEGEAVSCCVRCGEVLDDENISDYCWENCEPPAPERIVAWRADNALYCNNGCHRFHDGSETLRAIRADELIDGVICTRCRTDVLA